MHGNLRALFLAAAVLWSGVVVATIWRDWSAQHDRKVALALNEAQAAYHKDIAYRQWATHHGGVYVPITGATPPNPHLAHLSDRDVNTTDGKSLTLVNPAYMTRQVHELPETQYGLRGKLTSLQPLRSENAPDAWERNALAELADGSLGFVHALEPVQGRLYMRFMGPMRADENCLKCHRTQGYQVGDLVGGVSIQLPWEPYGELIKKGHQTNLISSVAVWGLGLALLFVSYWYLSLAERARAGFLKKVQRSEANLKQAQRMAKMGNWELHHESGKLEWSDEVYRIFGVEPNRFTASYESFLEAIHPEDRDRVDQAYQASLKTGQNYQIIHRLLLPEGVQKWVHEECETAFDPDGKPLISRGMVQDITQEHTLRIELEKLNKTLEKRVEEEVSRRRTSEQAMIQQSRVAAMGEMITAVAHHWRQPLSVVTLTVQSLRDDFADGALDEGQLDRAIDLSMEKIAEMSKAIDALRGVVAPSVEHEQCCLLEQVQEAYRILQAELDNSGITVLARCFGAPEQPLLECVCNPANAHVRIIASEFRQVVFSLLTNARDAIKGSGGGGTITIDLAFEGAYERLVVEDDGGGIEPEALEHIFDPFYTTKERGRGSGAITGTGLGLYMAKMIIEERMGGEIEAENGPKGARLTIRLPLS